LFGQIETLKSNCTDRQTHVTAVGPRALYSQTVKYNDNPHYTYLYILYIHEDRHILLYTQLCPPTRPSLRFYIYRLPSCKDHRYRPLTAAVPFANPLFQQHYILSYWVAAVVLSNDYYILCPVVQLATAQDKNSSLRTSEGTYIYHYTYIFSRRPLLVSPTGIKLGQQQQRRGYSITGRI